MLNSKGRFNLQIFDLRIDLSDFNDENNSNTSPFFVLNSIVKEYFKFLDNPIGKTDSKSDRDKELKNIIARFYGINTRSFSKEEIALLTGKTTERIRQIIKDFNVFLKGVITDEDRGFKVNENSRKIILNFYSSIKEIKIISLKNFQEKLLPTLGFRAPIIKEETPMIYFGVFKITQRIPTIHHLRNNAFLFIDNNVKIDEYFEICYLVFLYLEKSIIPIEIEDIIIDIKKKKQDANLEFIQLACSEIVEVEKIDIDSKSKYQLRLDCLSTARDMVYRLLNERKQFIRLAEIRKEISHNLHLLKSNRKIAAVATTLAVDSRFVSQGRTGFWGLTEWEGNNDTLYELITNALIHFNKPLKKKEIFDYIIRNRPMVPQKSLDAVIYEKSKYLKLVDDTFILNAWKELYKDQISNAPKQKRSVKENPIKDQIKEQTIQLIQKNGGINLYLNSIVNALNKKFDFPKASVYKIISANEEFIKSEDENKKVSVSLGEQFKETKFTNTDTSVFVSYSWENQEYQEKVISFVDFLRKKGFNADLDIRMMQNETSIDFNKLMHAGIRNYDKVIVLLSQSYKLKAETFQGGVGKEYKYILSNMDKEKKKFILVSFLPITDENLDLIVPLGFIGKEIIDLPKDEVNQFQYLFSKLTDSKQYNFSDVASGTPLVQKKEIKPFSLSK